MSTTILIIEDDRAIAQSLQELFATEGYQVVWHMCGNDGIEYARNHTIHLIILDIRLPDGSGFDFCRQMRQLGMKQPILILTVQDDEIDKVLGLEMGADDYITKPFALRELLARVRAQLRRVYGDLSATPESDLLYVEHITIDRNRGTAYQGTQAINLTPTEFRLLVYLVQNRGRAITRTELLDAVWGYTAEVENEQIVNVHIRHLREKIELKPSKPMLILTVPGIGYRLAG